MEDVKDKRGYRILKEEAPDYTMWRTCFGRGYGPVVGQTTERTNIWVNTVCVCTNVSLYNPVRYF
jgi:hypothetical protein